MKPKQKRMTKPTGNTERCPLAHVLLNSLQQRSITPLSSKLSNHIWRVQWFCFWEQSES